VPDLGLPCRFTVKARDWSNWVKRASRVSDHVRITVGPDGVTVLADRGTCSVEANLDVEDVQAPCQVSSRFRLDYLDTFRKATSFQGDVTFWIGQDYPMRYEARPAELVCRGTLAPRLDSPRTCGPPSVSGGGS